MFRAKAAMTSAASISGACVGICGCQRYFVACRSRAHGNGVRGFHKAHDSSNFGGEHWLSLDLEELALRLAAKMPHDDIRMSRDHERVAARASYDQLQKGLEGGRRRSFSGPSIRNGLPSDKALVAKIYLGGSRHWAGGGSIAAYDLLEDKFLRENFDGAIVGKSETSLKALWSQNVFSGKALPPKVAASDDDVKKAVAANKNAIGDIQSRNADDSVKGVVR